MTIKVFLLLVCIIFLTSCFYGNEVTEPSNEVAESSSEVIKVSLSHIKLGDEFPIDTTVYTDKYTIDIICNMVNNFELSKNDEITAGGTPILLVIYYRNNYEDEFIIYSQNLAILRIDDEQKQNYSTSNDVYNILEAYIQSK